MREVLEMGEEGGNGSLKQRKEEESISRKEVYYCQSIREFRRLVQWKRR